MWRQLVGAGTPDRGDGKGCGARCEGTGERWCGWRERGHDARAAKAASASPSAMAIASDAASSVDSESGLEKSARTLGGDVTFLGGPVNNPGGLGE